MQVFAQVAPVQIVGLRNGLKIHKKKYTGATCASFRTGGTCVFFPVIELIRNLFQVVAGVVFDGITIL
ncbi:MAG: hypothetical protein WCX23_03665, partial [Candidatus Paceibacterota bacterium]